MTTTAVAAPRFVVRRFGVVVLLSAVVLGILFVLHLGFGRVPLTAQEVIRALVGRADNAAHETIVWQLRMPRTLVGLVAGAMLGLAGAILQVITRNPLASPELTAVTPGAVFAAVVWLTLVPETELYGVLLPFVSAFGGICAGALLFALTWQRRSDPTRLILTGIIIGAILHTATALVLMRDKDAFALLLHWTVGSLNGRVWLHWSIIWPWALVAIPAALASAGIANTLSLGDSVATGLGVRTERAKVTLFALAVMLTAGAVSVVGAVGFVGLMGPHIARQIVGDDARRVFIFGALLAACLLVGADIVSEVVTLEPPFETTPVRGSVPVGAVMAIIGAPFFVYLAQRRVR